MMKANRGSLAIYSSFKILVNTKASETPLTTIVNWCFVKKEEKTKKRELKNTISIQFLLCT